MKGISNRIFFIADTHFGHKNIIKYENRPFLDTLDMDKQLISKWNQKVKANDKVFVLGDFSFYNKAKTSEICHKLNGRKTLIMGNHDTSSINYYRECGFEMVSVYPIILDHFWMLSHEPLYICENMPYANIFGHVHSNKIYSDFSNQSFCACVERIDYQPILFEEIKEKMGIKIEKEEKENRERD